MKGWKTWTGIVLLGASQIATLLFPELAGIISDLTSSLGALFVAVGIAHKIEKVQK